MINRHHQRVSSYEKGGGGGRRKSGRPAAEFLTRGALPPDRRAAGPCKVPVRSGKRGDVLRAVPLLSWGATPAQAPTQKDSEESRKLTLSREREEEEEGPQPCVRGFCLTTPQAALGGRECSGARRKPTANLLIQLVVPRAPCVCRATATAEKRTRCGSGGAGA
uniref:Uncharacterized protein n=1 Tax=Rangifer tarandus platyrhynchus TaxID=3082113 RepID=A0ACB0E6L0_RANTA|nr:unnamed protein product [Rangifer tarandus platyrhynchus]